MVSLIEGNSIHYTFDTNDYSRRSWPQLDSPFSHSLFLLIPASSLRNASINTDNVALSKDDEKRFRSCDNANVISSTLG